MTEIQTIFVIDDPLVENLCDLEDCKRSPVRFAKLVARRPHRSPRSHRPACVGLYCCRKHADYEPLALIEDAQENMRGVKTHTDLWQALIDNYPQPVQIRIPFDLRYQRRLAESMESGITGDPSAGQIVPGGYRVRKGHQ